MKKFAAVAILVLLAMAVWNLAFDAGDVHVMFGDEELDGPLAALVGLVAGGIGMLVAAVVMVFVGAVLALVFAGLGVMAIFGLALGAIVLAVAVSPLMLPLLVPVAIVWFVMKRRKARAAQQVSAPVAIA
ncbi:MAG TPA: hypothetical protein VGE60_01225 [Telluria sp.]